MLHDTAKTSNVLTINGCYKVLTQSSMMTFHVGREITNIIFLIEIQASWAPHMVGFSIGTLVEGSVRWKQNKRTPFQIKAQ